MHYYVHVIFNIFVVVYWHNYVCNAEADSCGPRASPRMMTPVPCDLSESNFCSVPGAAYPWDKVKKFVSENHALMRRMYGEVRQVFVINEEMSSRQAKDAGSLFDSPEEEEAYFSVSQQQQPESSVEEEREEVTSTEFYDATEDIDEELIASTEDTMQGLNDEDVYDVTESIVKTVDVEDTEPTLPFEDSVTAIFYKDNDYIVAQQQLGDRTANDKNTKVRGYGKVKQRPTSEKTTTEKTTMPSSTTTKTTTVEPTTTQQTTFTTTPETTTATTTKTTPSTTPAASPQDTFEKVNSLPLMRGINACPVIEEVIAPYWANNTRGETLALMNIFPFEQYIHSEKCVFENKQMHCRKGCRCEQQYRLHRLLAFDPTNDCRGIFADWFRFPACCICKCYDLNDFGFMSDKTRFSHRQGRRKSVKPIPLMFRNDQ